MKVTITRHIFTDKCTMGMLDIDGLFQCYTLEPPLRADKPCCIPALMYKAIKALSPKFQFMVVLLMDVPGFTAVEWHPGNFPEDTEACTLVGKSRGLECIGNSKMAFVELMSKLPNEFEVTYVDGTSKF